jgi:hypothetical protein
MHRAWTIGQILTHFEHVQHRNWRDEGRRWTVLEFTCFPRRKPCSQPTHCLTSEALSNARLSILCSPPENPRACYFSNLHHKLSKTPHKASFFKASICPQVSAAVQQLVQLAHEALQEATQSSERTARELYRAARDALQLYRAIVPVQRQHQLESVPQLAMVFHNDCLYIAHHMRMLGLQVRVEMAVHAGS